jgi:D-ribose pyranose/furanose isomerase RbsD
MKKLGHLNRDISRVLARMGHTDSLVIADCGLPVPDEVECIDVSLALGDPGFLRVLDSVLADFKVQRAAFARRSSTTGRWRSVHRSSRGNRCRSISCPTRNSRRPCEARAR